MIYLLGVPRGVVFSQYFQGFAPYSAFKYLDSKEAERRVSIHHKIVAKSAPQKWGVKLRRGHPKNGETSQGEQNGRTNQNSK